MQTIQDKQAELREIEGDIEEAVNERQFDLVSKLNRKAAILRASIRERKQHQNTRAFITSDEGAALLTVEDTAEYQAKAKAINDKYAGRLSELYLNLFTGENLDETEKNNAETTKLLAAKQEEQAELAAEFVIKANAGLGSA